MATDPDERPSAGELAAELERFVRGLTGRIALIAGVVLPIVALGAWWYGDRFVRALVPAPDLLPAGSEWDGWSFWTSDPAETKHPLRLTIERKQGEKFWGTQSGHDVFEYAFRIEGVLSGNAVRWRYVEQIRGTPVGESVFRGRGSGAIWRATSCRSATPIQTTP